MITPSSAPKVLVNLGSGESGAGRVPGFFSTWRQVRVDVDPDADPDLLASMTDLTGIADQAADAIWASHCLEHLYQHELSLALAEMRRILGPDGFACIKVPDLQTVAGYLAADQLHEVLYTSPAGPVSAHDVVFGFGAEVARGSVAMAHRTGFTPSALVQTLQQASFQAILVRRLATLELVALACKRPWVDDQEATGILDSLDL